MTEKGKALWILALLSPMIAEMLSGSSPPREFFNPFSFALLLGLYGGGVVVVRELSVIWNKGWASVIVMGAAYGILEEGVAIKSFFDPNWMDLGGLGEYGRYLGTNWIWAVWLTIFHSAVSITLPILLIAILYPHLKGQRFLTRKRFETVLVILFLDVLVCTALLNPYVPLVPMYLLSIGAVFGLVYFAKHLPKDWLAPSHAAPTWSPRMFAVLGFMFLLLCFLASGMFVGSPVPFLVPIVIELVIAAAVVVLIMEHIGMVDNLPQRVGFASGILIFFIFLGAILTLGGWLDMIIPVFATSLFVIDLTRWSRGKRPMIFRVGRLIFGDSKAKTVVSPLAAK
ncbi:MAG: hypothetical protein ABIE25_09205 [Thermoplasmatota archaeon]